MQNPADPSSVATPASGTGSVGVSPPVGDLAQATFAVSAEGDQVGPSGSPSAGLDLATLQQYAAIAEGRLPLPGEQQPEVPANQYQAPTPGMQSPQVQQPGVQSAVEQQLAVMQAKYAALEQMLLAQQAQAQQPRAPQVDYAAQRAAELQAAGMNPQSREHQAMYDLWHTTQQQAQQLAQMQQVYAQMQQQAQVFTYQAQVAPQVDAAFAALGIQQVPAEARRDVLERVVDGALRGDQQALERAMAPYRALVGAVRPAQTPAPQPPRLAPQVTSLPAAPNPLDVVSVQGRGAGRSPTPATLEEVQRLIARRN